MSSISLYALLVTNIFYNTVYVPINTRIDLIGGGAGIYNLPQPPWRVPPIRRRYHPL
jgi:hypothetical protein